MTVMAGAVSLARTEEFRFGDAAQTIQGGPFDDVDVLADHVGGDASVAQPQCQRVGATAPA